MTMAAVAIGGLSIVSGALSSKSSRKLQKQQLALMEKQFAFDKQRYDDYQKQYGGTIQKLVDTADKGVVADLAGVTNRAATDVRTQFANADEARMREMQRMGINPNSGRAEEMARKDRIAEAAAAAGNITTGREQERRSAEDLTYGRRAQVANMGLSQLNNASDAMRQTSAGMSDSLGMASRQAASDASQAFAGAAMMAGQYFGSRPVTTKPAPTTGPVAGITAPQYMTPTAQPTIAQKLDSVFNAEPVLKEIGYQPQGLATPFYKLGR